MPEGLSVTSAKDMLWYTIPAEECGIYKKWISSRVNGGLSTLQWGICHQIPTIGHTSPRRGLGDNTLIGIWQVHNNYIWFVILFLLRFTSWASRWHFDCSWSYNKNNHMLTSSWVNKSIPDRPSLNVLVTRDRTTNTTVTLLQKHLLCQYIGSTTRPTALPSSGSWNSSSLEMRLAK